MQVPLLIETHAVCIQQDRLREAERFRQARGAATALDGEPSCPGVRGGVSVPPFTRFRRAAEMAVRLLAAARL
jgi:hypothetical protein